MADNNGWWDGTVNGVTVEWFEGNGYVRIGEYETLLLEMAEVTRELDELKQKIAGETGGRSLTDGKYFMD